MIEIRLKHALSDYEERTGEHLTHADLAEKSGVSKATIDSMASRDEYNTTLNTIDRICTALECEVGLLLRHKAG